MKALHDIRVGTQFVGNHGDNRLFRVTDIRPYETRGKTVDVALVYDTKEHKQHRIQLDMLRRYDITIVGGENNDRHTRDHSAHGTRRNDPDGP